MLINPGFMRDFHMFAGNAVVIGSEVFLSGTGRVNLYGIVSEESLISSVVSRVFLHDYYFTRLFLRD